MLAAITENLAKVVETSPWLAPLAALLGGLLTAANPCVLAMVPLMMGYVAGSSAKPGLLRSFLLSLVFTLGLTVTFSMLFLLVWAASGVFEELFRDWRWVGPYLISAIFILMGLHLLGLLNIRFPAPTGLKPSQRGFIGALLLGMLFGLVSLPCAGPILAVVLAVLPKVGPAYGATLLASYSLGHCALILVGGTSIGMVQRLADSKGWTRGIAVTQKAAGVVILILGLVILFR